MANLKGGSFVKQIKDALYRLDAQGEGRHMQDDHLTHSNAVWDKREMYLKDFANWVQERGLEGKLNILMTEENVRAFLNERLADLSPKTALDYTTGFNSMMKGLEEVRVTIPANIQNDFLKDLRDEFRAEIKQLEIENGRYINNLDEKIEQLKEMRYESGVIAQLQKETGFRVNEALEVAKNFDKYYNPQTNTLEGVVGKGNHIYAPKEISFQLANSISKIENIPHYNTYRADLKEVGIERSHDIRVTYAKDLFESKLEAGKSYKDALKEVSEEINHHRENMTQYYLERA